MRVTVPPAKKVQFSISFEHPDSRGKANRTCFKIPSTYCKLRYNASCFSITTFMS